MSLINLSNGQIAFLIIVPIIVIAGLFCAIFFPLRKRKMRKEFKYYYYRFIYKEALYQDLYLINNFMFKIDDTHVGKIDHILFANKYIYIINDYYFDGDIEGKDTDASLIFISRTGKKKYMDNLLLDNKKLISKLSLITGINSSLMIGVSLVNKNCNVGVSSSSKHHYIVQANKFKMLLNAIESRPIGNINQEQLAKAVQAIDKLNRKTKKNAKK
jgi:hypothetical protein